MIRSIQLNADANTIRREMSQAESSHQQQQANDVTNNRLSHHYNHRHHRHHHHHPSSDDTNVSEFSPIIRRRLNNSVTADDETMKQQQQQQQQQLLEKLTSATTNDCVRCNDTTGLWRMNFLWIFSSLSFSLPSSPMHKYSRILYDYYETLARIYDLIWSYIPPKLYLYCCYLTYLFWFMVGILVLRKTQNAIAAVRYVKVHGLEVSEAAIEQSSAFKRLLWTLDNEFSRPPAIFFLNQYALNMTFNFLCNTHDLNGVHDRLIFITLDSTARDVLKEYWPNVRQLYWPTPSLYRPFSFAEGAYQTLYLLRANLAVCLLKHGKSFWMMQQDTFWRRNVFDLKYEENFQYDAIFDQIGDGQNSQRAEWVNGANFFVHANNHTLRFFEAVARKLAHWYTPDMGIMIHQCHTWAKPKCGYIPHKIAHSWEWMYTNQKNPPYIMQLDCETDGGSKLMQLARFGFYFMNTNNSRMCNQTAVDVARKRMESGQIEAPRVRLSWGRFQFKVYWWIVDYMLWTPIIGPLMKPYLPLVGFCIMITI